MGAQETLAKLDSIQEPLKHLPGQHAQQSHDPTKDMSAAETKRIIQDIPDDMRSIYNSNYERINSTTGTWNLPKDKKVELAIHDTIDDILQGSRDLDEATESIQDMQEDDTRYTGVGYSYSKAVALYAIKVAKQNAAFDPYAVAV
jgi:hypothetical protein